MTEIQKKLFELRDEKYRDFQSGLIPSIGKEKVIGVRTPEIRKLAKELYGSEQAKSLIASLPHRYFEEDQLHAFLICEEKDLSVCLEKVTAFLPYIDNWATCDQLSPRCFYKHAENLLPSIFEWLDSENEYEVRFGIGCLMRYFLDEQFDIRYAEAVSAIKTDKYYIRMMAAWYFATALAKQYESIMPIISAKILDDRTHNKAIQKAIESRRIDDMQKEELRKLKVEICRKT